MAAKQPATTIRVSRRIMRHIESNSRPEESVNDTIKRLLKISRNGSPAAQPKARPLMVTVKVEKCVLDKIVDEAKPKEPRVHTLSRLLGLSQDDGNVEGPGT